ncbi:MAG: hypothetical protein M0Z82_03310 [Actinomycetota bacterium]|nr:hypothetical protein [Actinomycetota bacterium]
MTARRYVEEIELGDGGPGRLVDLLRRFAACHDGWANLQPLLPEGADLPPSRGLAILFGAPPVTVPVCTWVAGRPTRRGLRPDALGIQHASGPRAVNRLASAGLPLLPGWRWRQDNPRRGLVVDLPAGTDPGEAVMWLLSAGTRLCALELDGRWRARVHHPRQAAPGG